VAATSKAKQVASMTLLEDHSKQTKLKDWQWVVQVEDDQQWVVRAEGADSPKEAQTEWSSSQLLKMEGSCKVWMADSHQIMMIQNTKRPTARRVGCNGTGRGSNKPASSTKNKMRQPEVHTRSGRASRLATRWIEAMITQTLGTTGHRVAGEVLCNKAVLSDTEA
jgi:hypothetical protein